MDDGLHNHQPALLDELERALVEHFKLRSALGQARALLTDASLAAARDHVLATAAAHAEVRNQGGALLAELERAGARAREAEQVVTQVEGWRARERAEAQLAVEIFVDAESLGPARDGAWRPGLEPGPPSTTPVYLRDPELRVCGHFEPEVDLLIYDPGLGTLAMVQIVDALAPDSVRAQVSRYVDRATYLRHLLLTAREQDAGCDRQVISVELVLVHRAHDHDGDGQIDLLYEVGETLRDLAQQTDCLHAIGVNVLAAEPRGVDPARLRRAFSWLLHDTRQWFEGLEQRRLALRGEAEDGFGRLGAIELDEYRLPGRRTLTLDEGARLHLLHGHNGSGKSSLVEALELMVTGTIERLSGIEDYEHVVRNRWSSTPARVALYSAELGREPLSFELHGADRPARPLASGSRASSFRLDQTVMDRLARASDVDRAAELLAAFFADEAEVRERWQHAMAEAEAALARLPARVIRWLEHHQRERQDLHEVVVEQLALLADNRVPAALVDALLPIPRAQLRPLVGQLEALAQLEEQLERDGFVAADAPLWDALEAAFVRLASDLPERVGTVESVLRTLDRVGRWWNEGDAAGFDSEAAYAAALDEWLELSALAEIAEQQHRILTVLSGARAEGWELRRLDEAGAAVGLLRGLAEVEPIVLDDLERARAQWAKRREQLGRALRRSDDAPVDGKPLTAARARLDDEEIEELDRFGAWWAPQERGQGLGERIHGAIERGETHSFATALIGAQAWVTPIYDAAASMLEPLRELRETWGASLHRAVGRRSSQHDPRLAREVQVELDIEQFAEAAEAIAENWGGGEDAADELFDPLQGLDDFDGPLAVEDPRKSPVEREREPAARGVEGERPRAPARPTSAPPLASAPPASAPAPGGAPAPEPRAAVMQSRTVSLSDAPPPQAAPASAPAPAPAPAPGGRAEAELGLSALVERLRQAYEVSARAHEVGTEVQDSFVMRLAADDRRALSLVDALNELMALFTPARWAYEDIILRYQEAGDVSRLQFETGELRGGADPRARARADLRLNTAQLNAFTLALFLLCAPRVDNPIGLLVLDDPLQNMDELTVTTLARGLAKLMRVLPRRWSLMMLFHGEGDLARFHDEVECAVYFLPWLSPTVRGRELQISCQGEDSRLGLTPQRIAQLVALRP
ncbi:hypothetical protein ENSA5_41680 [Enhygromyxa salina]|uniref:Uncharacterized protein n=1 Tax=Enhygromyxa salina TaxID=215803 RepID=A0A2S9XMF5_9BACT|nr:ATP-binding protein [Enhygromyxa salina]PRP94056.1 hypothetical protein ENSA5_41680 [Enhygromyxa salina]